MATVTGSQRNKVLVVDTVNTGQGANELYAMNQNVRTSDNVTFNNVTIAGSISGYATESYVGNQITALVDSSPATMDTLNELAAALGDDPNFATTVSTSIGTKWTQDNTKISQWNTAYTYSQVGHVELDGTSTISGSSASNGTRTAMVWMRGKVGDSVNQINVQGASIEFGQGGTLDTTPAFKFSHQGVLTATGRLNALGGNSDQWNTAYGWGNHASAGYVTTNTTYSAGTGITLTGTTFSLTDTNSKLNLSGGTMTGKISMFQNNEIFGLSGTIANYPRLSFNSSEGTHAAKTQTLDGDLIGQIDFNPYTGTSYTGGGKVSFIATEAITSTQRGTEARIYSTKTGESSLSYHQFKDDELFIKNVGGTTHKYWHSGNLTTTNKSNYDTAYGWGNHASAGYLTSVLTPVNGSWWNSGFVKVGGDGVMEVGKYLDFHTSNTGGNVDYDLRVTASPGALSVGGTIAATGGNSGNWNTAYGWGDHASAGYYAASNPNGYTNNTGTMVETGTTFNGTYNLSFRIGANSYYSHAGMQFTGSTSTLNVNGNITLGGTVDGRNVATDGTKLDGIAAGATANVGDITAVTAGTGLTGGGASGSVTLNVIGGTGITANANDIAVDSTVLTTSSSTQVKDGVLNTRNNAVDDETLFAITDSDDTTSVRAKFYTTSTAITKVDDATAPASGVFKITGSFNATWGEHIPIDDESEIMFECWIKHVSGSDTSGNFYAGGEFYNGAKTSYGNTQRYWGADGDAHDSDTPNPPGWRHIKGVMHGGAIRAQSSTPDAQYVRLLILANYNAAANSSHFCGFRFYRSKKTISSLWLKTHNTTSYNQDSAWQNLEASTALNIIDNAGNITSPATITASGGNSTNWNTAYGWGNHASAGYTSNVGDITGVTAGTGLTGGGTSGTPTLNVIGGSGITANANDIAVDSTVIRTTGDQSMSGTKTFTGAVSIDNGGNTTPSFVMKGTSPTMSFLDDDVNADDFYIHINSNKFYILSNRTNDTNLIGTGWESPHPMYLDSSNNTGYLFEQRMFADNYHPNADKWTTARTLTLNGDVTGSVSWDGSADVTLTTAVANDSHTHSQVYIPDTRGAQRAPSYYPDNNVSFDFQNTADTLAGGDAWNVLQTVAPWSVYNNDHRQQQLAWTGSGGLKFRYATSESAWAGWQTLWTSGNDGPDSGLDADLLDGQHGSSFLRSDADDTASGAITFSAGTIYMAGNLAHSGDTNTYMGFHAADQWRVVTGGAERLEVNNSAVTISGLLNVRTGIDLADNDYIRMGSSDDMEMRFSGTQFEIDMNGGYDFVIRDGAASNVNRFVFDVSEGRSTCAGIQVQSKGVEYYNSTSGVIKNFVSGSGNSGSNLYWQTGTTDLMKLDYSGNLTAGGRVYIGNTTTTFLDAGPYSSTNMSLNCTSGIFLYSGSTQMAFFTLLNAWFNKKIVVQGGTTQTAATPNIQSIAQGSGNGVTQYHINFCNSGQTVHGRITSNNFSTTYATTSDYRVKEDVQEMEGATERLLQLNPVNFKWKGSEIRTDGFLAHEVDAIVPDAVVGIKDATEEVTDEEGVTTTVDSLQALDQAKLIPLLIKTIQELEARINALENA